MNPTPGESLNDDFYKSVVSASWLSLLASANNLANGCGIRTLLFPLLGIVTRQLVNHRLQHFPAWFVSALPASPEIFSWLITGYYKTIVSWLLRPLCPDCTMRYCYVRRLYVIVMLQLSRGNPVQTPAGGRRNRILHSSISMPGFPYWR